MKKILFLILIVSSNSYAIDLTPGYLHGEWCLKSVKYPDKVEQENINWLFKQDGIFAYQRSKYSDEIKPSGTWDIKGNKLEITRYPGKHQDVELVNQDKFVFKWFGDLQVERGGCD